MTGVNPTPAAPSMPIEPSPAVLRACDVLSALAAAPTEPRSVSELAREVGAPRATIDAVLLALAERGLVARRSEDLRYVLGHGCVALGSAARAADLPLAAATEEAEALARRLGLCVAVSVRDGDDTRVAELFDHGPPFGIRTRVGENIPLRPPFGSVFAAWDTPEGVARWLGHPDLSPREDEQERYRAALDAVRRRGYSVTVDTPERTELLAALEVLAERPDDAGARKARDEAIREVMRTEYLPTALDDTHRMIQMSAPVVDQAGRVHVAIMLLGPSRDLTGAQVRTYAEELVAAADRASRAVGGRRAVGGVA